MSNININYYSIFFIRYTFDYFIRLNIFYKKLRNLNKIQNEITIKFIKIKA